MRRLSLLTRCMFAATLLFPGAAMAQSAAEHHAAMIDIAATPPWAGNEEYYEEPPHIYLTREELEAIGEHERREAERAQAEHERRLREDAGYRDFHEGIWLPMPADAVAKGGPCSIHFARKGQGVLIMGPTQGYPGAFLSFYGYAVPKAKAVKKIRLSLRQTGEPDQMVQVFNSITPWGEKADKMGMVFFAVPTIEAAMAGMTDDLDFTLEKDGEMLMSIKWHGGIAERDKLKACLAGQSKLASK